jgi:hypothetical protein
MSENEIPESMLNRVARIIAHAEDCQRAGNTADAEADFARADAIMTKYAIDRAVIESRKTDRTQREEPVSVKVPFVRYDVDFADDYGAMFGSIARHNRCRVVTHRYSQEPHATIVGFPEDVEYTQMIWNSVRLAFVSKLDPTWDTNRTHDENIKILKEAGRKWSYIGDLANAAGFENKPNDGRLKAAYRRQCRLEGAEPTSHTQRHAAYRASYAKGFRQRIATRLYAMAQAAEDQVAKGEPGTALAMRDRFDDVHEALYRLFPNLRPNPNAEKEFAEWQAKEAERLAAMTPAERAAEERRQRRADERAQANWERENAKMQDRAGRSAGDAAARTVDLGAGKVGTGRRGELTA